MPSTSMWMFCACSSAHHKCDVTIALDSCTSNKNENKKAKTGLFGFLSLSFYSFDVDMFPKGRSLRS